MTQTDGSKLFKKALRHHQAGERSQALAQYGKLLRECPNHLDGHYLLGTLLAEMRQLPKALAHLQFAARLEPNSPFIATNLGLVHKLLGEPEKALEYFNRALALNPTMIEAKVNMGILLADNGDTRGETILREVLVLSPQLTAAWLALGRWLATQNRTDAAIAAFREAETLGDATAAFEVARLSGENPDQAPLGYVAAVFDDYANHFDAHLTETLEYRTPQHLCDLMTSAWGDRHFKAVVDLGCGTGLAAGLLKPKSRRLEGVDISPRMLDLAKERGLYDELTLSGIVEYLAIRRGAIDLAFAADVVNYLGQLSPLFTALAAKLSPDGGFAFSVETGDQPGFALQPTGRYRHHPDHVAEKLAEAGLHIRATASQPIRKESGEDVMGSLFVVSR